MEKHGEAFYLMLDELDVLTNLYPPKALVTVNKKDSVSHGKQGEVVGYKITKAEESAYDFSEWWLCIIRFHDEDEYISFLPHYLSLSVVCDKCMGSGYIAGEEK